MPDRGKNDDIEGQKNHSNPPDTGAAGSGPGRSVDKMKDGRSPGRGYRGGSRPANRDAKPGAGGGGSKGPRKG